MANEPKAPAKVESGAPHPEHDNDLHNKQYLAEFNYQLGDPKALPSQDSFATVFYRKAKHFNRDSGENSHDKPVPTITNNQERQTIHHIEDQTGEA